MALKPEAKKPKPTAIPAPVRSEDKQVQAAGQMKASELANKKGRLSTYLANPAMRTGFSGMYKQTTGGA